MSVTASLIECIAVQSAARKKVKAMLEVYVSSIARRVAAVKGCTEKGIRVPPKQ